MADLYTRGTLSLAPPPAGSGVGNPWTLYADQWRIAIIPPPVDRDVTRYGGEAAANAWRIYAALRAVEGISTASLESGVVKELLAAAIEAYQYSAFHSDTCAGVAEYEEGMIFDQTAGCTCYLSRLETAIQKARGESTA